MKLVSVVVVGLFTALTLTGCTNPRSGMAALDREAESGDALPADLPDDADDNLEPASSRFVGEHDGNALYLAQGKERNQVCLLVYPDTLADWAIGCGGSPEFGVGGPGGDYVVRPDGAPVPEGYVEIASNVFAHE